MSKEAFLEKLAKESDQGKRMLMMAVFIIENGSEEDKDRLEDILTKAMA